MNLKEATDFEEYGLKKDKVDVSIWCVTYNHNDFIRDAFEGFLMQKTNFTIEVVVYDDASTDGTSDIVREYAQKYPELFHAYISKNNLWHHPNRTEIMNNFERENLTGKYIACCEGDDFWVYKYKLRKQFDYMEQHPNTTLCTHNAAILNYYNGSRGAQMFGKKTGLVDDEELILRTHGIQHTSSFFYRADALREKPDFFKTCPVGDRPTMWWLGYLGDVYYFNEIWSAYRFMHEGSWSTSMLTEPEFLCKTNIALVEFYYQFDKTTNYKYKDYIDVLKCERCKEIIMALANNTDSSCDFITAANIAKEKYENKYNDLFDIAVLSIRGE